MIYAKRGLIARRAQNQSARAGLSEEAIKDTNKIIRDNKSR